MINNDDLNEKINNLIDDVISGVNNDWPTIYKIRYVYLEVGKRMYKDADFFFSADGKLGESNLAVSEIKDIYNSNLGRIVNSKYLRVICKSSAYILKLVYDKLGIISKLVETNTTAAVVSDEEDFLINHWFLAIYDHDTNKTYFATLVPDLPYIQMNMATKHFGVNISYKKDYTGEIIQVYKGDEIKHSVISKEELKKIDLEIGYINKYYHYNDKYQLDNNWFFQYDNASLFILRDSLKDNKLFYELEINETDFYKNLMEFEGYNKKRISLFDCDVNSITEKDWNCWIKYLCKFVLDRINNILGDDCKITVIPSTESKYWNYEAWLFNLCSQVQYDIFMSLNNNTKEDFSDIYIDVENFKFNKWSKNVKKRFNVKQNKFDYSNILLILDKMNSLVNCVMSNRKQGNFNELFQSLAYHFVNPDILYENNISEDGLLSSRYIANKFYKLFNKVFSCNELVTEFNNMGYAEKVTIIKEVLAMMFPEINRDNSYMLNGYNEKYSAIFNRIHTYPIKSKKDGYFSIMFNVLGNSNYYFLYNAKTNTFKIANSLDVYNDYIVISNRMKDRISIEDLEKIDEDIDEFFDKRKKK